MTRRSWGIIGIAGMTLGLYLLMLLVTLPHLQTRAGGMVAFDLRPFGYSVAEARALLEALAEDGRAYYRQVQHGLDFLFPLFNGALVFILLARWRPLWPAHRIAVLAGMVIGFDWLENLLVHLMLLGEPATVSSALIVMASLATMAKSLVVAVAYCLIAYAYWRFYHDEKVKE